MKYFLTGATGFLGGHLAHLLREKGHEVVALVRNPAKATNLASLGIQLIAGDVGDKASMREAMRGCDGVFHVAGWYKIGSTDKAQGQKTNVEGTLNVLELMQELGIPKGVYTSTVAINSDTKGQIVNEDYTFRGKHLTEYDRTKAAAHDIANEFMRKGLPLVTLMPGLIYGPGDTSAVRESLLKLFEGKLPAVPTGTAYSWAHVEDIAQAHLDAMEQGETGENYIIAGEHKTLKAAIQTACELTGCKMPMSMPGNMLRSMAPLMGFLEKLMPVPQDFRAENLRVTGGTTYLGDNSKAKAAWGYNPRPFDIGWADTVRLEWSQFSK